MKRVSLVILFAVTAITSMSIGYVFAQQRGQAQRAQAQQAGPEGTQWETLGVWDLGEHFKCMEGMMFRMSRVTVAPNFVSPRHGHVGRPGLFYVEKGSATERQFGKNGAADIVGTHKAGTGFVENADLSREHILTNPSNEPLVVIYAAITPKDAGGANTPAQRGR
jgi:hypothetical protein